MASPNEWLVSKDYVQALDAEGASQEAVKEALERLQRGEEIRDFWAYVFRSAKNNLAQYARENGRRLRVEVSLSRWEEWEEGRQGRPTVPPQLMTLGPEVMAVAAEEEQERAAFQRKIKRWLKETAKVVLTEGEHDVYRMCIERGLSVKHAAYVLQKTPGAIRQARSKILKKMVAQAMVERKRT